MSGCRVLTLFSNGWKSIRPFNVGKQVMCVSFHGYASEADSEHRGKNSDTLENATEQEKNYNEIVKEATEYREKYLRALAETENVRRRMQRQIEDTKSFVMQGFCKDLLEVADILNTALDSLEKAESGDSSVNDNLKGMREGVSMTKDVLLKTFAKHGLQAIQPHGEKFDPNFHDALFEVPADNAKYPPGHVNEVLKVGYRLHERPIRPAKVSVVKE